MTKKQSYTGMIRLEHVGGASKSGRVTHVFDSGDGRPVPLRLVGGNAMREPAFDQFVNMRVKLEGTLEKEGRYLQVDALADIVVLGPPGRPARPPQP